MMATQLKQCHECLRWVAGRDPQTGWCRGCTIAKTLSPVDRAVLMAVRKMQPTTIIDIADEMGFASTSTAHYHLRKLRRTGLVHWEDHLQGTVVETVQWPEGERV